MPYCKIRIVRPKLNSINIMVSALGVLDVHKVLSPNSGSIGKVV